VSRGLIIFARDPVPGKVKTRLAQRIGNKAAAKIYSAMLSDIVHKASSLTGVRTMIFWAIESGDVPKFPELPCVEMFIQSGSDLGSRMDNAFSAAFSSGISQCCIIGSDSPDLPTALLLQAFDLLDAPDTDIVYGPAEDGGYYLLGMKRPWSALFNNMQWSSPDVLEKTLARINTLGLAGFRLATWYDIDTYDDLQRFFESGAADAPLTLNALQNYLETQNSNSGP